MKEIVITSLCSNCGAENIIDNIVHTYNCGKCSKLNVACEACSEKSCKVCIYLEDTNVNNDYAERKKIWNF